MDFEKALKENPAALGEWITENVIGYCQRNSIDFDFEDGQYSINVKQMHNFMLKSVIPMNLDIPDFLHNTHKLTGEETCSLGDAFHKIGVLAERLVDSWNN